MTDSVTPSPEIPADSTPLMKQYWELKAKAPGALLLFRMGDFYELFGDDAVEAARILEITLTSRDKNKANPMPMAGVPHHSVQGYIQRLLKAGKKVAIGEQVEDPALVKGNKIVRRDIVRTFTPGIQFDGEGGEANYLAVLLPVAGAPGARSWVLACLDASTGEALVGEPLSEEGLSAELANLPIRHLLVLEGVSPPEGLQAAFQGGAASVLVETLPSNYLALEQAQAVLQRHYEGVHLNTFVSEPTALRALGVAVTYTLRTQQQERLEHLRVPMPLRKPRAMALGPRAPQHLDLISQDGSPNLYQVINRTRSSLGARQLKRWLLAPLKDPAEIAARQEAVREVAALPQTVLSRLQQELAEVYDLERIAGRVTTRLANPRDTLALGRTLRTLPNLIALLRDAKAPVLANLRQRLEAVAAQTSELAERIVRTQRDDAPLVARDGGIFNVGTTPELDRLLSLSSDGQRWLIDLETREREATGIPSLKVRYNRVFGYYIEITQAHLKNAPAHYQRKQTTVGAERFFTEELKKFEDEIVNASARQKALEQELFASLLESIQRLLGAVMEGALVFGELDSLASLAVVSQQPGWCFPEIDDSLTLDIEAGRHPLVDEASRGAFVPNDVKLGPETRLTLIITGPNMGGKSTVMRQTALVLILGQMGAPVPARRAHWGVVSSLYTRIGAHDAIARGQSTFMVEMSELAHILHHADERSFIVLDEIGRGTSTYDGISVAWATLEWICSRIRARTLFATHYHELTRLTGSLPLAANAHMAVEGARSLHDGSLRFLYLLREGATNDSFGIHVARIAGIPKPVVSRAWEVLEELERNAPQGGGVASEQLSLFGEPAGRKFEEEKPAPEPLVLEDPVTEELRSLNVNELTPIQALNVIARLQEISRESSPKSGAKPNLPPPQAR